ncbi:MAG TPA: tRNA (N(6)-L-threonylcarbamoyladenosine(37)-C(2))-methylthiotransferase MtaB [Candidatus Binatia bacterium]|nr:tRNA (N(6)-L-threonylcarbamoyladenosine(37)-C(2))-methylthiotransferase MtaB [Candidatus Binatia bacterium]
MTKAVATSPEGPSKAPRVSFWTLGCRLNQYDTAALRARLLGAGLTESREGEASAEILVVNTCTVTRRADQEARQLIRKLHRVAPGSRIVVTGCYAQRAPEEIRSLPGVTAVLGAAEREHPDTLLRAVGARAAAGPFVAVGPGRAARPFATEAPRHAGRSRALLKVQDGCDSFCAFCVVPYVRGRSRSLPLGEALERAGRLLEAGFLEIVLTGADLGDYGRDLGQDGALPRLVEGILGLGIRHRVRLSSIEPHKVDPALAAMIGVTPRLCRHLHLPLQSGSNRVLRAMRRGYTREDYGSLLAGLAERGPVGIGADVIVGFPGEGDAEFEETRRFLEEAPVTFLHVFRYSTRPGTAAARLSGGVPEARARERSEILRALGEAKTRALRRALVGARLGVVLERGRGARGPLGMSDLYVPVELDQDPDSGEGILDVTITGEDGVRLLGTPVSRSVGARTVSERAVSDRLTL